ncbi:hypothetical protein NDA00_20550 [Funiculus sociatus GB2-M2]|uniref:hypothetical protein n=1 Tax=Funiculus sociatus TaxID=450527 RepID=UPI0018EF67D0
MLRIVRDEAFPFFKMLGREAGNNAYIHHMENAVSLNANRNISDVNRSAKIKGPRWVRRTP